MLLQHLNFRRGSTPILIALGLATTFGVAGYLHQTMLIANQAQVRGELDAVEGFYTSEVAMLYGAELDRRGIAQLTPVAGASTPTPTPSLSRSSEPSRRTLSLFKRRRRSGALQSLVDLNPSAQFTPPASMTPRKLATMGYYDPDMPLPKKICGVTGDDDNGFQTCMYRLPPIDFTGVDPLIVACMQQVQKMGKPVPFTNAELRNPRRLNYSFTVALHATIRDSVVTPDPSLILLTVTSYVSLAAQMQLLNPNGYYCINTTSILSAFSSSQLACQATIVSAQNLTRYDLYPQPQVVGPCS